MIHWSLQAAASARGDGSLTVAERAQLARFRLAKRRGDWLAGRMTAKSVVAAALSQAVPWDWPRHAIEIACEPGGRPYARLAPEIAGVGGFAPGERLPISVSISHAEGYALCAATWSAPEDRSRRALGIDLGLVEPRSPAFVATFFTPAERRFVLGAAPRQRDARANLVWCAKEAVLKALGVGLTVDTLELTCLPARGRADPEEWPLAPGGGDWRPFVATCSPGLAPGGTIRGVWGSLGGFVAALAAGAATLAPARSPADDGRRAGPASPVT